MQPRQDQQEYKWKNRETFPAHLQHLADPLLRPQPAEEEEKTVGKLFEQVLERSDGAVLRFDDRTREMELYALPRSTFQSTLGSTCLLLTKQYSDSKNYFNYGASVCHLFGGRGSYISLSALRPGRSFSYGLDLQRSVRARLDDYSCSNRDRVSFFWVFAKSRFYDLVDVSLFRESRSNYLDLWESSDGGKRVFGASERESNILRESNLLGAKLKYIWRFGSVFLQTGWDYGNRSYYLAYAAQAKTALQLGANLEMRVSVGGGDMVGRNILKNDLFFRNERTWVGRSSNFLTSRAELAFKQYPYLSFLGLTPYLYAEGWGVFRRQEGEVAGKAELEYGIGVNTSSQSRLDISLFRLSGDKVGNRPFGEIKFSF